MSCARELRARDLTDGNARTTATLQESLGTKEALESRGMATSLRTYRKVLVPFLSNYIPGIRERIATLERRAKELARAGGKGGTAAERRTGGGGGGGGAAAAGGGGAAGKGGEKLSAAALKPGFADLVFWAVRACHGTCEPVTAHVTCEHVT